MSSLSYSDQQEIIRLCECHLATHLFDPDYHPNVNIGPWFVKYGDNGTLEPIYKTQEYLFSMAAGDLSAPRIPQVVAYFCPQQQWAYLVTERIDTTTPADTAPEAVAKALQWLRSLPIPPGLILGSVGGGCARHTVFGDFEAPLPFSSVKALQNYMNRAISRIHPKGRPEEIYILDDPLIFTHSDMDSSNFALDKDKRICMFGFRDIGVLPESFASYTLGSHVPFISNVAANLGWVGYPNRMSMTKARVVFITASDPTLGLDMHGIPKVR